MTKNFLKGMSMLALIMTLAFVTGVVTANAQSSKRQVADIPFDFFVGDKSLPAGQYGVEPATAAGDAIRVRGSNNSAAAIRLCSSIQKLERVDNGVLVFHRYGTRYYLAEIWTAGQSDGRRLVKSPGEKATQHEMAAITSRREAAEKAYERVEVALDRK